MFIKQYAECIPEGCFPGTNDQHLGMAYGYVKEQDFYVEAGGGSGACRFPVHLKCLNNYLI